ncbi:hypothetical protein BaRGS_00001899 [Batillaria attramentaria]|uniref:Uncharacterized protein n=1 Tax=Batillaria attramentaria TaxID=370345 RepID=A0ABD0M792_9CAEN
MGVCARTPQRETDYLEEKSQTLPNKYKEGRRVLCVNQHAKQRQLSLKTNHNCLQYSTIKEPRNIGLTLCYCGRGANQARPLRSPVLEARFRHGPFQPPQKRTVLPLPQKCFFR